MSTSSSKNSSHILLKDVEKIYPNGYKAIHGIDMQIEKGEFIVLVGPSGCVSQPYYAWLQV